MSHPVRVLVFVLNFNDPKNQTHRNKRDAKLAASAQTADASNECNTSTLIPCRVKSGSSSSRASSTEKSKIQYLRDSLPFKTQIQSVSPPRLFRYHTSPSTLFRRIQGLFSEIDAHFDPFQKHHCFFPRGAKLFRKRCRGHGRFIGTACQKLGNGFGFFVRIEFVVMPNPVKFFLVQCQLIGLVGIIANGVFVRRPVGSLTIFGAVPTALASRASQSGGLGAS